MTLFDGEDAGPLPTALVAWTVNVYAVPLVRPVTVIGLAVPVAVLPPGDEVTVYEVIGLPPLEAGGLKLTVACAFPAVAVTSSGLLAHVAGAVGVKAAVPSGVPSPVGPS